MVPPVHCHGWVNAGLDQYVKEALQAIGKRFPVEVVGVAAGVACGRVSVAGVPVRDAPLMVGDRYPRGALLLTDRDPARD